MHRHTAAEDFTSPASEANLASLHRMTITEVKSEGVICSVIFLPFHLTFIDERDIDVGEIFREVIDFLRCDKI